MVRCAWCVVMETIIGGGCLGFRAVVGDWDSEVIFRVSSEDCVSGGELW